MEGWKRKAEGEILLNVDIYQSLAPVLLWIVTAYSSIYFSKSSTFGPSGCCRAQIMPEVLDSNPCLRGLYLLWRGFRLSIVEVVAVVVFVIVASIVFTGVRNNVARKRRRVLGLLLLSFGAIPRYG